MPRRIDDGEGPAHLDRSSIENVDEPASLGISTRKEPAKHPTPAEILRICRNAKPATQPDCVSSESGALLSCFSSFSDSALF